MMDGEGGGEARIAPKGHPSDLLPDYVSGTAEDAAEVEAHLDGCARCRREVEVLRALSAPGASLSAAERAAAWRRLEPALAPPTGSGSGGVGGSGPAWLSAAWKVAAAAAVVVMGLGVWQVNREAGAGWNPTAAIRGWEEDLEDLRPAPEEVRLALGYEPEEQGVSWGPLAEDAAAAGPVSGEEEPR